MTVRSARLLALVLIGLGAALLVIGAVVLTTSAAGPAPDSSCAPATEECEIDLAAGALLAGPDVEGLALVIVGSGSVLTGAVLHRRRVRRGVERA